MIATTIKALSLWQPWASLIADGHKKFETRSWGTNYRGDILICCSQKDTKQLREHAKLIDQFWGLGKNYTEYSFALCGKGIAIATLTDCIKMTPEFINQQTEKEKDLGDWSVGRYAWQFSNVRRITPILVKGKQGLFEVDLHRELSHANQ